MEGPREAGFEIVHIHSGGARFKPEPLWPHLWSLCLSPPHEFVKGVVVDYWLIADWVGNPELYAKLAVTPGFKFTCLPFEWVGLDPRTHLGFGGYLVGSTPQLDAKSGG